MGAPDSANHASSRFATLALGLALVGAASMLYYHLGLFMPRALQMGAVRNLTGGYAFGNDFYPIWLTSREGLQQHRNPYSEEMTREIQTGLFGRSLDTRMAADPLSDYRTFAYPAFTDLLFWPLAELPFPLARLLLVVVLAVLTLTSVVLWIRVLMWRLSWKWLAIVFLLTVCSYPLLEGLYAGQLGLLVGFLLAASILALQRGRFLLAGIVMAFTTIKPQMTLLVVLYLLVWSLHDWRRRGRFCVGLFSTTFLLVGAALVVWPHWIRSWTHVVLGYHRYARPPLVSEVLGSLLGSGTEEPATFLMAAALLIAAAVLAWQNRTAPAASTDFWFTVGLLLCITAITLLPGQALYDHVILLPGIFLLASRWQTISSSWIGKTLLVTGIAVLLWPWLAAFSVIALWPLLTEPQFYSPSIFALPLRTAAAFPFVVLGLLALASRSRRTA
jgi:hypothetical protein